jgi:hypothetical protein
MNKIYAVIENGHIVQYVRGFMPEGEIIEVPDYIGENFNLYDYADGIWTKKPDPTPVPTLEAQIAELKAKNEQLEQDNLIALEALTELYEIVTGGM